MGALISAWLGQRLAGPAAQAIAVAAAATVAIGAVLLGLWWLREDARGDARAACNAAWEQRLASARTQAAALRQARQRRSEEIAAARARELAAERDRALERAAQVERELAARPRTLCYPRSILRRLDD